MDITMSRVRRLTILGYDMVKPGAHMHINPAPLNNAWVCLCEAAK